uniref:DUF4110 domain-containing protein n=1 Tax=Bionectria ochroleuca TaxID=29856 RepID=A0A8H7N9H4_BIOOC
MDSEFFNQLFAWNIERNRFMPLNLRKPRQQAKKGAQEQRGGGGRRNRQGNEEELLRQLAALETGVSLEDIDGIELDKKEEEEEETPAKEKPVTLEPPHMRFNAQLAVQGDNLYIYGGTYEKGDREFTFDDLYAINLDKLDGCKEIFQRPVEDWIESDDEDEEEGDEDDEDDEEEEEVEEYEAAEKLHTPSKRKKKQQDEVSDTTSETSSTPPTSVDDDDTEAADETVDDGLPTPDRSNLDENSLSAPPTSGRKSS